MRQTPMRRLAEVLLKEDLDKFVASRRKGGRAWRLIVRDLYDATDGQVDITYETLRSWYGRQRRLVRHPKPGGKA